MVRFYFSTLTMLVLIVCLLFTSELSAQSEWVDQGQRGNFFSVEIIKPVIAMDSTSGDACRSLTTFSGSIFLTGRYTVGKNFVLVADLPIARGELDYGSDVSSSQTQLGNPYLGAEYYLAESPLFFELGLRLPITPDGKTISTITGIYSSLDRIEAFSSDIFPVSAAANYKTISKSKILLRARSGINLWFNSIEIGAHREPAVSVDYTLQTGYAGEALNIIVGLTGRIDASSHTELREKQHLLQYGAAITVPFGRFRPGLNFKIPGNRTTERLTDYVVGLNFGINFR